MNPSTTPESIRSALDRILPGVQKPTRYLGLERNLVRKPWQDTAMHMALVFPDAYEIGMSHQGTRILYHLVNRRRDALAERAFAPWPDMAEAMVGAGIPLYSLESYRPIRDFDLLGISLQSELNFINVPYLLDLAGVSVWAKDRCETDPIVLGGGPCTANPEPVADFFDALLIGDGEASVDAIIDTLLAARGNDHSRSETLRFLATVPGVYVPSLYEWTPPNDGADGTWKTLDDGAPLPVKRVWVDRLEPDDQPTMPIVPFAEVVQDRLGLEIMRGCTQSCRFCQAGYWYRPVREHEPAMVIERIESQIDETGFEEVSLLSLSSADYSQIGPLVTDLSQRLADRRVSVSLPSLRADAFSVDLADAVSRVRKSGFTFAPETGSDRLRRVINKTFTNSDMVEAARAAFSKGWNLIKVYAMIGLPTETDDDLDELVALAAKLVETGRQIRGRSVQVKVSVGCFVPKPWTPFQWQPFVAPDELMRRIHRLKDGLARIRGAKLTWSSPEESAHEALLSRGDRRLAPVLHRAYELGAVFDGWGELARPDAWAQAIAEHGIDLEAEIGERDLTATLPWDIIDAGVRKGFLKAEWRRACGEVETADCKWGDCLRCGIPGDGADTVLAEPVAHSVVPTRSVSAARVGDPAARDGSGTAAGRRVRFTFRKVGDSRFLSHRQVMDALERALRAAALPVRFTQGFNPHIRLSMAPALSLGHETLAEPFDVECSAPIRATHIAAVNQRLPEGLEITGHQELLPGAPSLGKVIARARYQVAASEEVSWPESADGLPEEVAAGVFFWERTDDGDLNLEVNLRGEDGPTTSARKVFAALGIEEEAARRLRVTRQRLVLLPRVAKSKGPAQGQRIAP